MNGAFFVKIKPELACAAALWLAAAPAAAGDCSVRMKAVKGGLSYSRTQPCRPGERVAYSGPSKMGGRGPAREIIFNSFLNPAGDGGYRLDYQVEIAGENRARPPFQAAGKALLRPGRPVLAAAAGGWRYYLELLAPEAGDYTGTGEHTLDVKLKCGRLSFPASFAYLPGEQYTAVLYEETDGGVRKFMLGLLPGLPGADGAFALQYTLQLKEAGETLTDAHGELALDPGEGKASAAAGKGCAFTASASR